METKKISEIQMNAGFNKRGSIKKVQKISFNKIKKRV